MTATEIRRDVEGYSDMTEDAFARRFYADRAELDSLGIHLTVDRPADGFSEQENYSLAPGGLLPALDRLLRRRARRAADGAEPARRRVRVRRAAAPRAPAAHVGPPEPARLARPARDRPRHHRLGRRRRALRPARQGRHRDLPPQADRVRVLHDADGRDRRAQGRPVRAALRGRPVLPRRLVARARRDPRVPPLAHARQGGLRDQGRARLPAPGRLRPARLRQPHPVAARRPRRHGRDPRLRPDRLARRAQLRPLRHAPPADDGGQVFRTEYAIARLVLAWALGYEQHAQVLGPPELVDELGRRLERVAELHRGEPFTSVAAGRPPRDPDEEREAPARQREPAGSGRSASRGWSRSPPCSSRPAAAATGSRSPAVCEQLQISPQELREDVAVLNVVNFGGGAYVLYAEVLPPARSRSTRSPTRTRSTARRACSRSRPARCWRRSSCSASTSPSTSRPPATSSSTRWATSPRRACWSPTRARTTRSRARSARRSRRAA